MWAPVSTTLNPRCSCEREGGSVRRGTSSRKSSPDSMRPISTVPGLRYSLFVYLFIYSYNNSMYFDMYISTHVFCRLKRRGVLKRGIRGWRICVGGFGTWLVRKSRFPFFFFSLFFKKFLILIFERRFCLFYLVLYLAM